MWKIKNLGRELENGRDHLNVGVDGKIILKFIIIRTQGLRGLRDLCDRGLRPAAGSGKHDT
jgi:hypothetical protein